VRSSAYSRPWAACYLCAWTIFWSGIVGLIVGKIEAGHAVLGIFEIPLGVGACGLFATTFYLIAHDRSLADEDGGSWPLPDGWRAGWGRVLLGPEIPSAIRAFRRR